MAEMQITNQLLREAIADAEAVRETAIANAKLSLEETFTPQIKSMLERKLRVEAEGVVEAEEATELPHEDGEPEGSSEMPADSSDIGAGDNKEPSDDSFDSAEDDTSGEGHQEADDEWYEDWSESDFDLKEVIQELEEDILAMEGKKEEEGEGEEGEEDSEEDEKESEEGEEGEEDSEESEEEFDEEGEYPEGEPAGKEGKGLHSSDIGEKDKATFTLDEFLSMLEEAGYDVNEMGFAHVVPAEEPPMEEGDLNELSPEEIAAQKNSPEAKEKARARGLKFGVMSPARQVGAPERRQAPTMEENDLNLEEILAMMEAEDAQVHEQEVSEKMASEVQALQEELAEYREAVNILRGKLNEVNLLNAKLLYTNKIFRKEGLTNEQKVTIVEQFDRATTVREVKMVYSVLAESLVPQKVSKTTKPMKKVVAEGLASKPTPSTAPKAPTTEVLAENTVAKRLQQLAGII